MVKNSSQTVLALLRYRYLHKSRNNPLCPPMGGGGGIYGTNVRDFDRIQIRLLMVQGRYVFIYFIYLLDSINW